MKRIIIILSVFTLPMSWLHAQETSETKYFKDIFASRKVSLPKAKYAQTTTKYDDSLVIIELKEISSGKLVKSRTYKNGEPFGIWKSGIRDNDELDFEFIMNYADTACSDTLKKLKIKNYLDDNDSIGYISPKISSSDTNNYNGENALFQFLGNELIYPKDAIEKNITGTVYLKFEITAEGKIDNIAVRKGCNIYLDKEAVRVLRQLKFSNPPYLNGKPISLCFKLPLKFTLE